MFGDYDSVFSLLYDYRFNRNSGIAIECSIDLIDDTERAEQAERRPDPPVPWLIFVSEALLCMLRPYHGEKTDTHQHIEVNHH